MQFVQMNNETIVRNSEVFLSAFDEFHTLSTKFSAYHKNPTNVMLHLITTPIGVLGFFAFLMWLTKSTTPTGVLCGLYLLSLLPSLSLGVFVGSALVCLVLVLCARKFKFGVFSSIFIMIASYFLQDLAHIICNEKTFQSTYSAGGQMDTSNLNRWSALFMEHCYYLIPLCMDLALPFIAPPPSTLYTTLHQPMPTTVHTLYANALILVPLCIWAVGNYCLDSKNGVNIYPGFPYFNRVIKCSLLSKGPDSRQSDLKAVRDWTLSKMPPMDMSSHWWFRDLPDDVRNAFDRCAKSSIINNMFRSLFSEKHYCLDVVEGMNEVYVTGPSRMQEGFNSDQIFYTKHVDGPWGLIPFVSVFRCIVGMDRNYMTETHFPMVKDSVFACEGDVVGFDFNREVHYITRDDSRKKDSDDFRVVLKLHYCVYPRVFAPLGWFMHWLNVRYNQTFRALFLKTIDPQTIYEHALAWNVVANTTLFNNLETYIGQRNVLYLLFAGSLWYFSGSYAVFLALTSCVHYVRTGVDFGSFKRDVLLFKSIALIQIAYLYLSPYFNMYLNNSNININNTLSLDWISLAMILGGYTISVLATKALGIERTYFGAELGICEAKWITDFPYGYIPHPMILSQICALVGVHKADHFRSSWPYLVPIHVTLYTIHMIQEHFQIYDKKSTVTATTTAATTKKIN
eukprot:gene7448-15233_t